MALFAIEISRNNQRFIERTVVTRFDGGSPMTPVAFDTLMRTTDGVVSGKIILNNTTTDLSEFRFEVSTLRNEVVIVIVVLHYCCYYRWTVIFECVLRYIIAARDSGGFC